MLVLGQGAKISCLDKGEGPIIKFIFACAIFTFSRDILFLSFSEPFLIEASS